MAVWLSPRTKILPTGLFYCEIMVPTRNTITNSSEVISGWIPFRQSPCGSNCHISNDGTGNEVKTPGDMAIFFPKPAWSIPGELSCLGWFIPLLPEPMAQGQMSAEAQEQLQQLIDLHEQRPLTVEEQVQLDALRQEYGRMTLLKARAYALLSLRGGVPLLSRV